MSHDADVRYQINDRDEIIFVDDSWDRLAAADDAVLADKVLGRSLWNFIQDDGTRQIYRQIVARVRQGRQAQFRLRCDSPSCRRHMQMTIQATGPYTIEFATQSLHVEYRPPIALLARSTPRSGDFLRVCAWCNRVHVGADAWTEVELAIERLELFEARRLPQLTHGMCPACLDTMDGTVGRLEGNA